MGSNLILLVIIKTKINLIKKYKLDLTWKPKYFFKSISKLYDKLIIGINLKQNKND